MRIVDVPIPRLVYSVSVHKPIAEHATFADLVSGRLVYASAAFAARLRAAGDESARSAPDTGWDVLWRRYRAGALIGIESEETVTLACDGDDGGKGLYDRLLTALEKHELTEVTPHGQTAGLGAPVSCRWKRWTLGYERGMRARLVPDRTRVDVQPRTIPLMWCPECQEEMRPIERIGGYPIPEYLEFAAAMGEELDLEGCIIDPDVRTSHWRCAACRAELVPGSLDPEEVADMVLGGERRPVPHCPRTFTDGRVVVWAPNFALRGGGWSYRLYPRVAAKLAEAEHGWVATRHGNGATVFYDWREFSLLLPGPVLQPARPRVNLKDQRTMSLGGVRVHGQLLPWG
jgi:hypothetical protein